MPAGIRAQEEPPIDSLAQYDCPTLAKMIEAPYYYCDCKENSSVFAFPVETEVTDTVWYTASIDDLKQGISAYWFADCAVTMEVYAFCMSKEPTFTWTVGGNQMRDWDYLKIGKKLDEMGETAKMLAQTLQPHIRIYPHNGGKGKVYCYPYDQGPQSTCQDPLPLRPRMTYVCDKPQNSYRMESKLIAKSGKAFILWKQKQSKPCDIRLTIDSCNGEEIGRAIMSDSLHVYQPDTTWLKKAREENRPVWLHVSHEEGYAGRIYYYNDPKFVDSYSVKKSTCEGKTITVNMRSYTSNVDGLDTIWVGTDTLQEVKMQLTFTEPSLEYDTVKIDSVSLSRGYRYNPSGDVFYKFGTYTVDIVKNNTCTRRVQLLIAKAGTGITNVEEEKPSARKLIHNGQLYIIIEERQYTILGQQINLTF